MPACKGSTVYPAVLKRNLRAQGSIFVFNPCLCCSQREHSGISSSKPQISKGAPSCLTAVTSVFANSLTFSITCTQVWPDSSLLKSIQVKDSIFSRAQWKEGDPSNFIPLGLVLAGNQLLLLVLMRCDYRRVETVGPRLTRWSCTLLLQAAHDVFSHSRQHFSPAAVNFI